MPFLYYIPVVVLGAIWGSFINMAIYRVKHEQGFGGRSYCDYTKKPLAPIDLIPIFSYIIFRGRCRHCHKSLPILYPSVEIATAALFGLTLYKLGNIGFDPTWLLINFTVVILFMMFFIFFAGYDFLYWQVNVKAIKFAIVFALVVNFAGYFFPELIVGGGYALLAGVLGGGLIWLIVHLTNGSGMGEGDIFLMAFAGIFVGLSGLLPLLLISSITGSVVGLIKALKVGKIKKVKIQFGPFIAFAAIVTFLLQDLLLNWLHLDIFV